MKTSMISTVCGFGINREAVKNRTADPENEKNTPFTNRGSGKHVRTKPKEQFF